MIRPWSLRARLQALVVLLFVSIVAMTLIDLTTAARLDHGLDAIQRQYVPLLKYGPEVEGAFEEVQRAMQDAVAAQDSVALEAATSSRMFVDLLHAAPDVVDRQKLGELERAFENWRAIATKVSWKLLRAEGGEELVADIEAMQAAQRQTSALLARTVFLDETALAEAFRTARAAERTAAWTRATFHVVLFLFIGVVIVLTGRRIVGSFADLRSGFARFGDGDFTRPVGIGGEDEVAVLGRSADQMARRIEELQRGLRTQQRALEESNRELESFSYSVSHDLRAPLRAIDGFSAALLEDYGDKLDEDGKGHLHRVRAGAKRMAELIDDLLALSRIARGEVRREPVDLSDLVARTRNDLQDTDPGRRVEWAIATNVSTVADRRLLAVAIENLLGNAWKFTSKQAEARIEFGERDSRIYFVSDNGAGFDMEHADKLFGAFQRLHRQTDYEGTGIGLATVHRVVTKHGGRIWAEAAPGKGATFYFTLEHTESS